MSTILRSDVYLQIMSGRPFDAEYVKCDRKRGTGGELVVVKGWSVAPSQELAVGSGQLAVGLPTAAASAQDSKLPNHAEHGTVNICNPANSGLHIHKVHLDLITFFNGKRVIN